MTEEQKKYLDRLNTQLPAAMAKELRQLFPMVFFPNLSLIEVKPDNGHYVGLDRD